MKRHRIKRTRVQRILRGLRTIGKYSTTPAVALMLGCVPTTNLISVSPDGRYVAVPVNEQTGVSVMLEQQSKFAVIDLQTGKARLIDHTTQSPFWLSNAKDTVVCTTFASDEGSILIMRGDKARTIDKAVLPSVSDDGRYVVYTAWANSNDDPAEGKLMLYDTQQEKTADLHTTGAFADISPDGKRILFAVQDKAEGDDAYELHVMDRDGKNVKRIANMKPKKGPLFAPRWAGNDAVVYRTVTQHTGADTELFLTDLKGDTQQLTANDLDDINAQMIDENRVAYLRLPEGIKSDEACPRGEVWVAERKDGKWTHRDLGIRKVAAFTVTRDRLVYVVAEEGGNQPIVNLFTAPLDDPSKATKLDDAITKAMKQ